MKIKPKQSTFEPCPEYTGPGVCVDVTPLKVQESKFGTREVFRIVFETALEKPDKSRFCVWSRPFTPSLHEKANLAKFLKQWLGTVPSDEFDTEELIGRDAQLVVIHETGDDPNDIFARIAACTPHKGGPKVKPCGAYTRVQDRKDDQGGGNYRRLPKQETKIEGQPDYLDVKIHVGKCKGLTIGDLSALQVQALVDNWLPLAQEKEKPLKADRELMDALSQWVEANAVQEPPAEDDNVPY